MGKWPNAVNVEVFFFARLEEIVLKAGQQTDGHTTFTHTMPEHFENSEECDGNNKDRFCKTIAAVPFIDT